MPESLIERNAQLQLEVNENIDFFKIQIYRPLEFYPETPRLRIPVLGTSLVVRWLRLRLPMQGVRFRSLVRELKSHMPQGQNTKTQNRSNVVTNSIKTLKMVHIKKLLKKKKKNSCSNGLTESIAT